jgi:hypothetical protein
MEKSVIFAADMAAQRKEQQAALRTYFQLINDPFASTARGSAVRAGTGLKEAAGRPVTAGRQAADELVDVKRAELDNLVHSVRDAPGENLGTPLRGFLGDQTKEMDKWADDVMEEFDLAVGDVRVRPTQTAELLATLDEKVSKALLPNQKAELVSMIGERQTQKVAGDPKMVVGKGGVFEFEEQADEIVLGLRNPDSELTVDQMWNALKSLKRMQRRAGSPGAEPMDTAVMGQLIESIQTDLRVALRNADPTLEHVYDQFITKYATETTRLKRGVIGKIMDIDPATKRPVIEDPRVFDELFHKQKGLTDPAEQLHISIADNPELMQTTREAIARHWKDFVFNDDGKLLVGRQRRWLEDYGPAARKFLNDNEMDAIIRAQDVAGEIEKRIIQRKAMYEEINASFEGQVYNRKRPDLLIRDMMVPGEEDFAKEAMRIIRKHGDEDTLLMVQDSLRRKVVDKITLPRGPDGYEFNLNAFERMLYKDANIEQNLRAVMGDQYVDDLFVLGDALRMSMRESTAMFNPSGTTGAASNKAVMDLTRAYVGLFTRAGRVVTASMRIRGRAANKALVAAVANPGDLRQLAKMAEYKKFDPRWVRWLGTVGATGLLLEEDIPPPPTTGEVEFPQ